MRRRPGSPRERPIHVLFLCSRNQWRSPTAERVARGWPGVEARSAGTSPRARRTVGESQIRWADIVIAMETKHRSMVLKRFSNLMEERIIYVLDIPDDYQFMDPALVDWIETEVPPLIADFEG